MTRHEDVIKRTFSESGVYREFQEEGETGGVTRTELAADVVTSLGKADSAYQKPAGGIPASDLAAVVQGNLAKAEGALQASTPGLLCLAGKVTLNGINPTPVLFGGSTSATIVGEDEAATLAIIPGSTLIVNPDGAGDDTVTFAAAGATSVSGADPSTDLTAGTDRKLMMAYNGAEPVEIAVAVAGLNTGELIAQAISAAMDAAFPGGTHGCVFAEGVYTVTVGPAGTGASVAITSAAADDMADDLKLGAANGGTETAGSGDFVDCLAATKEEIADAINAAAQGWSASAIDNKLVLASSTSGAGSSLVVNEASTVDIVLGLSGTAYGVQGLSLDEVRLAEGYAVLLTPNSAAKADILALSAGNRAATGFDITATADDATLDVDVLVVGQLAEEA